VIVTASFEKDDPLLSRVRRSMIEAKNIDLANAEDHRKALVLTAEIRGHIELLTERLGMIENEMRAAAHRAGAMDAYRKVAGYGRRAVRRGKGVN
jgi:hypothetical protein